MQISLPAFDRLCDHVGLFASQFAIMELWEIYARQAANTVTEKFYEWKVEKWKSLAIGSVNSNVQNSRAEIEQILFIGNPAAQKTAIEYIKSKKAEVNKKLSKQQIEKSIDAYNKNPEPLYIREDGDDNEENWVVGMKKNILDKKYLKLYMSDVINGLLLSKFNDLCDDLIKTFEYGVRANDLFAERRTKKKEKKVPSVEENILDHKKFGKIIEKLVEKEILDINQKTQQYVWLGVGRGKVASLAVLATYLERYHIVETFEDFSQAATAYLNYFNPKKGSRRQFTEHYNRKLGDDYKADFGFISTI